jgi:hypothetical protein
VPHSRFAIVLALGAGLAAGAALAPPAAHGQETTVRLPCGLEIHAGEASGTRLFPQDETFCPVIADPKHPRSFLAFQRGEFGTLDEPDVEGTSIGAIGLADSFGLVRWGGSKPGDGFHLGLHGGIFAQFDLDTPSVDLINADYLVGLPLTWRRSAFSARIRLYHQSSHLGDEYVLRGDEIRRENLSFESFEVLVSAEAGPVRVYGGGEHLFRRDPESVERKLAHAGLELRVLPDAPVSLLAGLDVKMSEQHDWSPGVSARAGIRLAPRARAGHPVRRILILAEYYDGASPYGQFFLEEIRYAGIGIHLLR